MIRDVSFSPLDIGGLVRLAAECEIYSMSKLSSQPKNTSRGLRGHTIGIQVPISHLAGSHARASRR